MRPSRGSISKSAVSPDAVYSRAGEVKLSQIAGMISPYPTRTEVVKRAASSNYTEVIFSDKFKGLAGFWTKFH